MTPARVFSLGFHADYRCRSSGACCSSGWEIPVTPAAEGRIRSALDTGRLRVDSQALSLFRARRDLPDGARAVFGLDAHGRCALFEPEGRLCAVHGQIGAEALPPACRQFPRVALLTPVGVFITLSHYCPTAARPGLGRWRRRWPCCTSRPRVSAWMRARRWPAERGVPSR